MDVEQFLRAISERLTAEPAIEALFLAGSHGQSKADRFSDIDLVAIADEPNHKRVAGAWRSALGSQHEIVFWNEFRRGGILVNAITESWLRCDLYVVEPARFVRRSRANVRPLFDRGGIYDGLPEQLPPARPDPKRVSALIHEFIRVLGLMTVGMGRGEYVTLVKGAGLLRDMLTDLMLEECQVPDRGGALHLSRLLDADQMAVLENLPYPSPEPEALLEAHAALAETFFPMARRLAGQLDIEWPEAFEAATRRHLFVELGMEFR
ncbi:MAG: aminoglycoside 6-adenylyltransferase [Pseudomonadota bacterium]